MIKLGKKVQQLKKGNIKWFRDLYLTLQKEVNGNEMKMFEALLTSFEAFNEGATKVENLA
jgi:hypothetical protein